MLPASQKVASRVQSDVSWARAGVISNVLQNANARRRETDFRLGDAMFVISSYNVVVSTRESVRLIVLVK
jgi:hypothetical protein